MASLLTDPVSLVALAWLAIIAIATIAVPLLSPYEPIDQDLANSLAGPSLAHPLGTDQLGRDTLVRLAAGAQVSLGGVLIATTVAIALGSVMGVVAGYFGSLCDSVFTAIADILMSIPVLVILLSVAAVTTRDTTILMIVVGVLMSTAVYRVLRGATLNIRGELFVTAARTSGLGPIRILINHIFGRLGGLLIVQIAVIGSLALVAQVGLGFLGIDAAPPRPSWGNMIKDASMIIYSGVGTLVAPVLAVVLTVLAFSGIAEVAERALGGGKSRHSSVLRPRITRVSGTALPTAARTDSDLLRVEGLSVSVPSHAGHTYLVSDVSIDLRAGEVVGLVGESGAGKSVTARSVLGILPYSARVAGSIKFQGKEILGASARVMAGIRGRRIAFVGQEPMASLSPVARIGSQLAEAVRRHRRVSRHESKRIALELLSTVQISNPELVARAYPHEISGGMAQRVMIAIALSGEPELLVADEPTTALDVSVQMQILELLRDLRSRHRLAILIVTHDWGVVADICDRAVVMYAGQVVEEASVADLFAQPGHPYSKALRSADPHFQEPRTELQSIPGSVPPPGMWPEGCRFQSRCVFVTEKCTVRAIPLLPLGGGRTARCIRVGEFEEAVE
ncbi:MAG: dipeptide/oligopeptide/nickel ABC transporter permease/ATP-binding protein [Leucobacter sp.]